MSKKERKPAEEKNVTIQADGATYQQWVEKQLEYWNQRKTS